MCKSIGPNSTRACHTYLTSARRHKMRAQLHARGRVERSLVVGACRYREQGRLGVTQRLRACGRHSPRFQEAVLAELKHAGLDGKLKVMRIRQDSLDTWRSAHALNIRGTWPSGRKLHHMSSAQTHISTVHVHGTYTSGHGSLLQPSLCIWRYNEELAADGTWPSQRAMIGTQRRRVLTSRDWSWR